MPRFSCVLLVVASAQVLRCAGQTITPQAASPLLVAEDLPKEASDVVSGMVQGFLGGSELPAAEMECLEKKIGLYAKDVVDLSRRCVELLEQVVMPKDKALHHAAQETNFDVVIKLKTEVVQLIELQSTLIEKCTKDHTLDALHKAREHFRDVKFVGGRLVANGADIVSELSDGIISFREKKFLQFGKDIGLMWRKVLLSKAKPHDLEPTPEMLEDMSIGLVKGFFGPSTVLTISSDTPNYPNTQATLPAAQAQQGISGGLGAPPSLPITGPTPAATVAVGMQGPPVFLDLKINLHQCVSENMNFFQSVWTTAYLFFAQASEENPSKDEVNQMQGSLGVMLMGLPGALQRCKITSQQSEMLVNSVKALKFNVAMPHSAGADVSMDLEKAVRDWTAQHWKLFGEDIGRLIQQMVLEIFPQEYSIDSARNLRKITKLSSTQFRSSAFAPGNLSPAANIMLAAGVVGLLSMVVGVKVWRSSTLSRRAQCNLDARDAGGRFVVVDEVVEEVSIDAQEQLLVEGLLQTSQTVRANDALE